MVDYQTLLYCTMRKRPILVNRQYCLAELTGKDIHERLKHISVKQTRTEICQRFWKCNRKGFICTLLHKRTKMYVENTKMRIYEGPPYSYTTTPPLTKLRLEDAYKFYTTRIDNFGLLFVKNIFNRNLYEIFKAWITFYPCAATHGTVLKKEINLLYV